MNHDRGIALILALLVTSFLSAIALGLTLVVFMDRLATGNLQGSVALLHAADAGIAVAAHDLARIDWNDALTGSVRSAFTDGAPGGVRAIPGGGAVNLTASTNQLNCGKSGSCTTAQMNANTGERPWGANNARWQLFAYGPFGDLTPAARPVPCYLMVWIADDHREQDADPLVDGDAAGRGVLRVRAETHGPMGARRAIEAELMRVCWTVAGEEACQPGVRVQSWQEVRQVPP